jgi:hypothetical protein
MQYEVWDKTMKTNNTDSGNKVAERQKIIDRIFPGDKLGEHKFNAYTTKCDQCGVKFTDWAKNNPIRLCPVIGMDEVDNFHNGEENDWQWK